MYYPLQNTQIVQPVNDAHLQTDMWTYAIAGYVKTQEVQNTTITIVK
jgi:hypothetical protein